MRTTLNIDDEALVDAMTVAAGRTKTAVISEALREFARRRRPRGLLRLQGKFRREGDLNTIRKREAPAQ